MMSALGVWVVVFVLSLLVLVKASDFFTASAERIGVYLGIPSFIVGVTIVALGTSLPELLSSIVAVFAGSTEIVVGNVVGSNIANILLVLGLSAVVGKRLITDYDLLRVDLPLLVASAFLLTVMIYDGEFTRTEAVISLAALLVYLIYAVQAESGSHVDGVTPGDLDGDGKPDKKQLARAIVVLAVSALFIFIGAKYTIEALLRMSAALNIGKEIIAASAVAFGTSLPELMVSVSASRQGKEEMAIGNILGSNIFNTLAVMGIPALFAPLVIPHAIIVFSLPMMIAATLLYFFMTQDKEITQWEGWLLIIFYVVYIGKLFGFV